MWLCAIWVMSDLAREVSTQQMLLCLAVRFQAPQKLMAKRCPKGRGVFTIGAVSKKRRRMKIGAVELCRVGVRVVHARSITAQDPMKAHEPPSEASGVITLKTYRYKTPRANCKLQPTF